MKPNELYKMKPVVVRTNIADWGYIEYYVPEINHYDLLESVEAEGRVVLHHYTWGANTIDLFSIWFDGKPVMICKSEGEDTENRCRYITDKKLYEDMVHFLMHHMDQDYEFTEPDVDVPDLVEFRYADLHERYGKEKFIEPSRKVGDIVWIKTNKDPYDSKSVKVNARVRINAIFMTNTDQPYLGRELDRGTIWHPDNSKYFGGTHEIVEMDKGNNDIGSIITRFDEQDILGIIEE